MTSRQFYIILSLMVIATKMQRFPVLLFSEFGKDGFVVILGYVAINILGILCAFFIHNFLNKDDQNSNNFIAELFKKILMIATCIYFIIQALLLFEHVQNIFADTLFDKFSWSIFSLLFLFAIFFLARTGIKNIALNFELFSVLIIGSLVLIAILGVSQADYSVVLPLQTINLRTLVCGASKFNVWFGDFFIILYMLFHTKKPKLSKTILFYLISMCFVLFLVITFNGVYGEYSQIQSGLISTITEMSMLGINIGRIDWFLILIAEISTILSCAICIYFANKSLQYVFKKSNYSILAILIALAFYLLNVWVIVDKFVVKKFFFGFGGNLAIILKFATTLIFLIISFKNYLKIKNAKSKEDFNA